MSTAVEIEAAVRTLSPTERQKRVHDLPALLPELDGDEAWDQIIRDARVPRALVKRFDAVEAEYAKHPEAFAEIRNADFDRPQ